MKTCNKCDKSFSLLKFHKKSSGRLGRTAVCKMCIALQAHMTYQNPERRSKIQASSRAYNNSTHGKLVRSNYKLANISKLRASMKLWQKKYKTTPKEIKRLKNYTKDYYVRNNHKRHAHEAVYRAVKKNLLDKLPCQICGVTNLIHAHHEDYSFPLDVIWLCGDHHRERHSEIDGKRSRQIKKR